MPRARPGNAPHGPRHTPPRARVARDTGRAGTGTEGPGDTATSRGRPSRGLYREFAFCVGAASMVYHRPPDVDQPDDAPPGRSWPHDRHQRRWVRMRVVRGGAEEARLGRRPLAAT